MDLQSGTQISAAPSFQAKVETCICRAANHTGILHVPQAQQPPSMPTESNPGVIQHLFTI